MEKNPHEPIEEITVEETTVILNKLLREINDNPLNIAVLPIAEVCDSVCELFNKYYALSTLAASEIIENNLCDFLKRMKDDLYVVIESPYVDKNYRDTYYKYYSSKLIRYNRDCIRLSFFSEKIEKENFRIFTNEGDSKELVVKKINDLFCGFLVLRPTFPKIIGRNAIAIKALKEENIECCLAKINTTVGSLKLKVASFPHASQDNQTMTCAETTIWSIMEYFGNKYPEYKPVLFSQINSVLHKFSYKRLLPSDGLTAEQITFTIRELGFGAVIYSKEKQKDSEFPLNSIISTYVESGLPIIVVLKSKKIGHAVSIVGKEKLDKTKIIEAGPNVESLPNIIDYNKIDKKYVYIDDNYPPYQISDLEKPCEGYYDNKDWHDCEISNIVVPLYTKIYLDVTRASKNFYKAIGNSFIGIQDTKQRVLKIYLASSRSYKEYIALNKNLNFLIKEFILALQMPKFIWVAEVSTTDSFLKDLCDELYIQDATEPVEYTDKSMLNNLSLLAGYSNDKFFINNFGTFKEFNTFAEPFDSYKENLK